MVYSFQSFSCCAVMPCHMRTCCIICNSLKVDALYRTAPERLFDSSMISFFACCALLEMAMLFATKSAELTLPEALWLRLLVDPLDNGKEDWRCRHLRHWECIEFCYHSMFWLMHCFCKKATDDDLKNTFSSIGCGDYKYAIYAVLFQNLVTCDLGSGLFAQIDVFAQFFSVRLLGQPPFVLLKTLCCSGDWYKMELSRWKLLFGCFDSPHHAIKECFMKKGCDCSAGNVAELYSNAWISNINLKHSSSTDIRRRRSLLYFFQFGHDSSFVAIFHYDGLTIFRKGPSPVSLFRTHRTSLNFVVVTSLEMWSSNKSSVHIAAVSTDISILKICLPCLHIADRDFFHSKAFFNCIGGEQKAGIFLTWLRFFW